MASSLAMVENKRLRGQVLKRFHRSNGKCPCGQEKLAGFTHCKSCRESNRVGSLRRKAQRRELGMCQQCGNISNGQSKCVSCQHDKAEYQQRLKRSIIDTYGGRCKCCGETEIAFLTIDHVNNDGNKHRLEIKNNSLYTWLKKNSYPQDEFQLLCFNCNCGKRVNGGICPHHSRESPS